MNMPNLVGKLLARTGSLAATFIASVLMAAFGVSRAAPPTIAVLHAFHVQ